MLFIFRCLNFALKEPINPPITMNNDILDNFPGLSPGRSKIPIEKLMMGSITGKYAVALAEGRAVVFISDKKKEAEIGLKYEALRNKIFSAGSTKHH